MSRIYLVHHGETEWNREGRLQGHLNSPLTTRGRQEARAAARTLQGRGADALMSSDLGRAAETARIIANMVRLPVIYDARLRERHLGALQGRTTDEISHTAPTILAGLRTGSGNIPDAEAPEHVFHRAMEAIQDIATGRHDAIVITHDGVIRSLLYRALGMSSARIDTLRGVRGGAVLTLSATLDQHGHIALTIAPHLDRGRDTR